MAQELQKIESTWTPSYNSATKKQMMFIRSLLKKNHLEENYIKENLHKDYRYTMQPEELSISEASNIIENLLKLQPIKLEDIKKE